MSSNPIKMVYMNPLDNPSISSEIDSIIKQMVPELKSLGESLGHTFNSEQEFMFWLTNNRIAVSHALMISLNRFCFNQDGSDEAQEPEIVRIHN